MAFLTLGDVLDHVKLHLGESTDWDHLSADDVKAVVGLTVHALYQSGAIITPDVFERAVRAQVAQERAGDFAARARQVNDELDAEAAHAKSSGEGLHTTVHVHGDVPDEIVEKLRTMAADGQGLFASRPEAERAVDGQATFFEAPRELRLKDALFDLAVTTFGVVEMAWDRMIERTLEWLNR